jgi:hypothetical protein
MKVELPGAAKTERPSLSLRGRRSQLEPHIGLIVLMVNAMYRRSQIADVLDKELGVRLSRAAFASFLKKIETALRDLNEPPTTRSDQILKGIIRDVLKRQNEHPQASGVLNLAPSGDRSNDRAFEQRAQGGPARTSGDHSPAVPPTPTVAKASQPTTTTALSRGVRLEPLSMRRQRSDAQEQEAQQEREIEDILAIIPKKRQPKG